MVAHGSTHGNDDSLL